MVMKYKGGIKYGFPIGILFGLLINSIYLGSLECDTCIATMHLTNLIIFVLIFIIPSVIGFLLGNFIEYLLKKK
jgi:hypothetical protein